MSQLFTPKNAERNIFRLAIFQDGIWDMQIGGTIMLFSFYPVTRRLLGLGWNLILLFGLLAILLFIGAALKRNVSNPRMGLVKYGKSQKSKLLTMRLIIFGIFLVTSTLAITLMLQVFRGPSWGAETPEWLQLLDMDIVFGLFVVAIFSLVAGIFQMWRPFFYGLLLGGGLVASGAQTVYSGPEFHYPFAIAGGIIFVIGLGLLLRFVHTYQIPAEGA
ncbi:MAG: hypothetical protein PVJ21_19795 [Anaerolineales bacterium]|jgi:hypothetical protein